MKKNKDAKFEEKYFKGWYKTAVGNFTIEDLEMSKKWFYAWLKKLNQYIPVEKGNNRKVLEIGCSIGAVSNMLTERGFTVWASDISEYAVKNAQKLTPEAKFLTLDIQNKIPLKQKLDMIIAFEVVEHLENPEVGIKNIYNALEEKGKAVISTPYPYKWNYHDPTHINLKKPKEWVKIMKNAGFKNVKFHRFSLLPFFYRYNKHFQIILPFAVPLPYVNSPIYFIGTK